MPNVFLLAKRIRKGAKAMAWKTAVAKAAKQIKSKSKIGAYKVIEKGEKKSAPAKKVVQVKRSSTGRFQGYKKISGNEKHLDSKSHNIKVRIGNYEDVTLLRVNNAPDGSPRYVTHFLNVINGEEKNMLSVFKLYEYALKKAKKIGGKKYHNKSYGGGIAFTGNNPDDIKRKIKQLQQSNPNVKI